jgi:hypothetical protein
VKAEYLGLGRQIIKESQVVLPELLFFDFAPNCKISNEYRCQNGDINLRISLDQQSI